MEKATILSDEELEVMNVKLQEQYSELLRISDSMYNDSKNGIVIDKQEQDRVKMMWKHLGMMKKAYDATIKMKKGVSEFGNNPEGENPNMAKIMSISGTLNDLVQKMANK